MRIINTELISAVVAELCIESNLNLPKDLCCKMTEAAQTETNTLCRQALNDLCKNFEAAKTLSVPICQDTGMAVVFLEIGQDVKLEGKLLKDAVNEGVARGYEEGFLRKSIVGDPFKRSNTGDNTPAVIHTEIISGDKIKITVAPKGFGSENMSALRMFNPTCPPDDIMNFVTETVITASGNPCPPLVIGVGIGGNFEYCAYLAKKAICRNVNVRHTDSFYETLEIQILNALNKTGIGTQGFGGDITALAVNIETFPTHIAGLPVAVNIGCHVNRHASKTI